MDQTYLTMLHKPAVSFSNLSCKTSPCGLTCPHNVCNVLHINYTTLFQPCSQKRSDTRTVCLRVLCTVHGLPLPVVQTCSDMFVISALDVNLCINHIPRTPKSMGFQHSSQSTILPFPPGLYKPGVFQTSQSGQKDGCCVMSVIAAILPFSQRFNFFMLLPNLNWDIICILYMITFPLSVIWQWGLHTHVGLHNTPLLLWHRLVNNNTRL
jgi:hypothetical protein